MESIQPTLKVHHAHDEAQAVRLSLLVSLGFLDLHNMSAVLGSRMTNIVPCMPVTHDRGTRGSLADRKLLWKAHASTP